MKKKLTLLAFSLLLAVGWTNSAQAQRTGNVSDQFENAPNWQLVAEQDYLFSMPEYGQPPLANKAPRRGHDDVTANEVSYTKADYAAITYTWYEDTVARGTGHTAHLTDSVTNKYQMYWLLRSTYMNPAIPGIRHNDVYDEATQYYGVGHGWNIGTASSPEIRISLDNEYGYIMAVTITDMNGNTVDSWTCTSTNYNYNSTSFPSGWRYSNSGWTVGRFTYNGSYRYGIYPSSSSGAFIRIPYDTYGANAYPDGLKVTVTAMGRTGGSTSTAITLHNGLGWYLDNSTPHNYISIAEGERTSVTAPNYNAYTIFIAKLKDFEANLSTSDVFTHYTSELLDVFDNYFAGFELLTDGLRVGGNSETAGTVFAYQGVLNRFFFIGKGKTATRQSTSYTTTGFAILGPFYEMYEEFSPTTVDAGVETADFYQKMWNDGEYYPVVHDCATVLGYQHFFSMYGKDTTVYKSVSPIVLYIPDQRSLANYRTYEEGHQPQVGLYRAFLTAETEPAANYSDDYQYYTVTLDWTSTLNDMVNNTVNQTYEIYKVTFDEQGNRVYTPLTTLVNPESLTYSYDEPQTLASQQITYVVLAYPTTATNNYPNHGVFYTYSNLDDVQIPGLFDFMVLYRERYESDFIIKEEKNYYRNYLYPTNLAHGTGMTMGQLKKEWPNQTASYTLWRDNTGVAVLEVKAIGNKVYYRIQYYDDTQTTTGVNNIEIPNGYQTISND